MKIEETIAGGKGAERLENPVIFIEFEKRGFRGLLNKNWGDYTIIRGDLFRFYWGNLILVINSLIK